MTDIGVIGGDEAVDTLNELCGVTEPVIRIERVSADTPPKRYGVLVINDSGPLAASFLKKLTREDAIVLNADNKALYRYLSGSRGKLITYGFSGKSCVTASSVVDGAYERIQFCIQRSLPTLTGGFIEPQEFSVCFDSSRNVHCALAAVTAALIAGSAVENLSE